MKLLLRLFSFLFHLPLALFLFALGTFALIQGVYNMNIDFVPWSGKTLTWGLFGMGLFGLFALVRAAQGKLRILFGIYALIILVLSVNGAFLSTHRYDSPRDFQWAVAFVAAALLAFLGSLAHIRR